MPAVEDMMSTRKSSAWRLRLGPVMRTQLTASERALKEASHCTPRGYAHHQATNDKAEGGGKHQLLAFY